MRRLLLLVLLTEVSLSCSCDYTPNGAPNQQVARRQGYLQTMVAPAAEAKTYLSLYTTHKVECESGESLTRRFSCTQAKVDLAHIERAWQQALAIAEEMTQDTALSEGDRNDAQKAADQLRAGIQRIQSAKPGKLPQL